MNLADIFSNYFEIRRELVEATRSLDQKQLAWKSNDHPNSIGWLLTHIAEAECWWISVVATKSVTLEEADLMSFEKEMPADELFALLDRYLLETKRFLELSDTSTWDTIMYDVPGRPKKVSQRWLAWHVVEHQARHRGQIFMLMHMQGLEVPKV